MGHGCDAGFMLWPKGGGREYLEYSKGHETVLGWCFFELGVSGGRVEIAVENSVQGVQFS